MKKVVLAYSGGLDTTIAVAWLREKYRVDVVALSVDVGQKHDSVAIRERALRAGASKCVVLDARREFANEYVLPALRANALYEGVYPLASALSRPLISRLLVEHALREEADGVAHGCTGKGNDQVRFDVSIAALDPDLAIVAPVREHGMSRDEAMRYAREHGIDVPTDESSPYSIDENLWGRSIECGPLEDPWAGPPDNVFEWTVDPWRAPSTPRYIDIEFVEGSPMAVDGTARPLDGLIAHLNELGGRYGVGRVDHVEDRVVGIKSRELYECPAAAILIAAHRDLEKLVLPRETLRVKAMLEQKYAELAYEGLWFSPLREAIDAFVSTTQRRVTGTVRVELCGGSCRAVGRRSEWSLYVESLATYSEEKDDFDHRAAEGFIAVWGLPVKVCSALGRRAGSGRVRAAGRGAGDGMG